MKISLLALISASLLLASCQKSSPRSVKAKLGVTANSQTSGADQKIDNVIATGKKLETCNQSVTDTKKLLDVTLQKASDLIKNSDILDGAGEMQALDLSNDIQSKMDVIGKEMVNAGAASCADLVLADLRASTDQTQISLANKTKKDTPASLAAKKRLAQGDASKDTEALVPQSFKITQDLAAVLTEDQKAKNIFFMDGAFQTTAENYAKALEQTDKTVCLLSDAPQKSLAEGASLNIVQADYSASEKQTDVKTGKVAPLTWTMLVRVTSDSEAWSFSCRLASNMKRETGAKQFKRAFGSLLTP